MKPLFTHWVDVANWIRENVPDKASPISAAEDAAKWWVSYRDAEVLLDETARHLAQALAEGIAATTLDSVTERVTSWTDDDGNTADDGGDVHYINHSIERDLRAFFITKW